LLEGCPTATLPANKEGNYVVEHVLCETVELTELELDAVAGGAFSINISGFRSTVSAFLTATIDSHPTTSIVNIVDNSINVS
jgi:hypothetical protein